MEEDKSNTTFQQSEGEDEDTFSLRDLPIHDHDDDDQDQTTTPRASTDQDLFEFLGDLSSQINHSDNNNNNNIVFCGKIIPYDEDQLNEYQKRDYLSVRSSSFHKSHTRDQSYDQLSNESDRFVRNNRSKSLRFPSSEAFQNRSSSCVAKCEPSPIRTVNITAITSMSTKSKCRMFMFAPVKFKPEMEMSAIKKRQSRRAPAPMFPTAVDGGEVASGGRKSHHHWGLARQLGCGAHLANVLARSFGCVSSSMV